MGLRGGLIGELFFQLKHMQKLPQFKDISSQWEKFPALMTAFWQSVVGEGWTVFLGEDAAFDVNIVPVMEGVTLDRMDTEFIRAISSTDTGGILAYLKAHFQNSFLDKRFPGLIARRSMLKKLLKYVPPADDPAPDQAGADKDDNDDNADIEKDLNQIPIPAPEDDPDATPEQIEILKYLDTVFNLIFDETAEISSIRFVRYQAKAVPEEKKDDDGGDAPPPVSKVTAVFIPVPPPVVDEDNIGTGQPTDVKPSDSKLNDTKSPADSGKQGDNDPDGDQGDDDPKPPEEPEVLPFVPEEEDLIQAFEQQVSLVDFAKKDLDVACYHVPLAKLVATKLFAAAANLLQVEGDLSDFVAEAVQAAVQDVREFCKETGRDVLYINSY